MISLFSKNSCRPLSPSFHSDVFLRLLLLWQNHFAPSFGKSQSHGKKHKIMAKREEWHLIEK